MGAAYTVLGTKVPAHWISIATIGAAVGGAVIPSYLPKSTESTPVKAPEPIKVEKSEELDVEKLLKYVSIENFLFGF
ncbi:hypothetical protein WICMUC_005694 [Wickerhamomyces mucosus]|uniref:ATP synthase subunit K, mitochondrial n=1 Tax=Wickerhamomyces mucosus TaxID=1378264 RepID=A0A9P8T5Y4_9ASCO|nr:hypothetical protein WICMUC_005694 [Wickerhamomyces mucosus]